MRRLLLPLVLGLLTGSAAQCQLVEPFNAPRSNCCLVNTAKTLSDQLQDWDQIGRYHDADVELKKQPADPKRVVFMGDSITDGWHLTEYFPGKPYVNRGISGQVTAQMLVRMYPDVVELKPAAMVILAGTNDIARNNGPETAEMIEDNLMAMADIAQKNGIKVVYCSIMPISDYPYLPRAAAGRAARRGGRRGGGRGMARPANRYAPTRGHRQGQRLDEGVRREGRRGVRRLLLGSGGREGLDEGWHLGRWLASHGGRLQADCAGSERGAGEAAAVSRRRQASKQK